MLMQNLNFHLRDKVVAVLMGGPGKEREVSLRSGAAVANALGDLGAKVVAVDVKDSNFKLPAELFLAFNMLHGTYGEDGGVQEELDRRGVAYTGEGVQGSRMAFDKLLTKKRFCEAGVPTVEYEVLDQTGQKPTLSFPMVLKAPRQGSSVGVHIVKSQAELSCAFEDCFSLDREVLVEKFFVGKELTVGILAGRALPIVEIVPHGDFYKYENKYTKGGSEYFVPARISRDDTLRVQEAAELANAALGLEVYGRVDILLAADGGLNVLEINTIPGMTETSLLPMAAAQTGLGFGELCLQIADISLKKQR